MNLNHEFKTLSRFLSVGVLNTLIDLGLFNVLFLAGAGHYFAASISFLTAVANSYAWNRSWTFAHVEKRPVLPQFSLFLLTNIVGLGINLILQYAITQVADETSLFLANAAKLMAIGLVVLWNYGISRFIVFRPQKAR